MERRKKNSTEQAAEFPRCGARIEEYKSMEQTVPLQKLQLEIES